jgi:CDP-4-dehydro-6-deoxyglucose reductase, E1
MDEKKIRDEIFKKVSELYQLREHQSGFVPGTSPIPYAGRVYDAEEMIALVDASLDFWLTAGRFAQQFEKEFADFLGMKYCLLTNSGSSANLLAVSALTSPKLGQRALKAGDEVITTACGFPTTLNPILQNNLVPVFLDVELGSYNIRADLIEEAISDKTKAILIPHTLGNPADLDTIMKMVRKYDLWFIEDNCDALGSRYRGQLTGTFGHISTSSFYPAHHITMGEGGAVLINDPLLKKIIASFRDWGRDCWCDPGCDNSCRKRFGRQFGELPQGYDHKYVYSHIGYNLKVTDMQAAVGVKQLKKLPGFIERRKENFNTLYQGLKKNDAHLILPKATANSDPSWFGFPILVKENAPFTRDKIVHYLESNHIATRMLFGGNLLKQPAYSSMKYRKAGPLENTDLVMKNLFWIGVYPGLTGEMLQYTLKTLSKALKSSGGKGYNSKQ